MPRWNNEKCGFQKGHKINKGRIRGPISDLHRKNLSKALKGKKRKPCSDETKKKISKANSKLLGGADTNGYLRITIGTYPNYKRVCVHRWTMEQKLGRKLYFNENVHHINGNKSDNRIENLELVERSVHSRMHRLEQLNKI